MAEVIAVLNQKGGVGKTTTAVNLASYYADKGMKVLAVDIDHQGNLSDSFLDTFDDSMVDFFTGKPLKIYPVKKNLDVIPCEISFAGVEMVIINELSRERKLLRLLTPVKADYDIIIIDCPPALNMITVNGLVAADWIVVPLKPSAFSYKGIAAMINSVNGVRDDLNSTLTILGIVLTFYDNNRVVAKKIVDRLENDGLNGGVFRNTISASEALVRAEDERKSIFEYDKNSKAAKEYAQFAEEVLEMIDKKK